jgi:hypothetical protein
MNRGFVALLSVICKFATLKLNSGWENPGFSRKRHGLLGLSGFFLGFWVS